MTRKYTFCLVLIFVVGCTSGDIPSVESTPAQTNNDTNINVMKEHFAQIETWLKSNAPDLANLFNPPATDAEIAAFEQKHNLVFPPELKQLYLVHNGEKSESDGIFGCWKLLPLERVSDEIELMDHEGRIPILLSGGSDSYYVKSFDESKPDTKLYECWHEQPDEKTIIAQSLNDYFTEFNKKLIDGQYVLDPDSDNPLKALVDKDEL